MVFSYLIAFLLPLALTLMLTPWTMRLANRIGAVDHPNGRKVHTKITPRLGGLAIVTGISISLLVLYVILPDLFASIRSYTFNNSIVIGSMCALLMLGVWDDLKPLKPGLKFGVQFIVASAIYFAGFKIPNITNPFGAGILDVEFINYPLTVLWIVGITNAFNLIDGLDGLAAGIASIAGISIFMISAIAGQVWLAVLSAVLVGALLGFLRYNFNPAKIFMGDSGSLFIGFSLALLSIESTNKLSTGFAILFPLLILGLPITDTMVSMVRRFLGSFLPNTSQTGSLLRKIHTMFMPDKAHIHHQLLNLGFSHRNTVLVLYGVSGFFAAGAFSITQIDNYQQSITIALMLVLLLYLGIKNLHYREISVFENGLIMPVYENWILNRTTFLSLIDMVGIAIAFLLSIQFIESINPAVVLFDAPNTVLISVVTIQLMVYWVTGIYQESIRQMGIGNAIGVFSSIFYAVLATTFFLLIADFYPIRAGIPFLVINLYLLLTFTLGLRVAYRALIFWFNRANTNGKNMLIYGANQDGTLVLNKITGSTKQHIRVIGFLDDDPRLEGKRINGYPILGSHWNLAKLKSKVDTILICENSIKPENFRRLKSFAREKGIELKQLQFQY